MLYPGCNVKPATIKGNTSNVIFKLGKPRKGTITTNLFKIIARMTNKAPNVTCRTSLFIGYL